MISAHFDLPSQEQPGDRAEACPEHAFAEAIKLARRIRVLIDAGEYELARALHAESRGWAVTAIEMDGGRD